MRSAVLPSLLGIRSASLVDPFRSSIARPTDALIYASTNASQRPPQDSGSRWSRFSFPVGILPPLQHAGLTRRTPVMDSNLAAFHHKLDIFMSGWSPNRKQAGAKEQNRQLPRRLAIWPRGTIE